MVVKKIIMNESLMMMVTFMNFTVFKILSMMFVFNGNFKYWNSSRFPECCQGETAGAWASIWNLLMKELVLLTGDKDFIFNLRRRYTNKSC